MIFRLTYACLVFFVLSILSSGSSRKLATSWSKHVKVVKGDKEGHVVIASRLGKGSGQNKLFKRAKGDNEEIVDEKGDGIEEGSAFYIPGKKEKLEDADNDNKTKHNDKTSEIESNEDSKVAIYIPGNKGNKDGDNETNHKGQKSEIESNEASNVAIYIPGHKGKEDGDNQTKHKDTSDTEGNVDSDVAIYIPGNKGKLEDGENQSKHNDKTSEIDGNEDSEVAVYIPGNKSEGSENTSQLGDKNGNGNDEPKDNKKFGNESVADKSSESKNYEIKNKVEVLNNKMTKIEDRDSNAIGNVQENVFTSWPLGIIPYYFDMTSIDNILANRIRESMEVIEGESCIQFKQLTAKPEGHRNWIHITNSAKDRACVHRGMHQITGEIRLTLGLDCLKRRNILHSLLHAIGFADEVTHPYSDQYIRIVWDNIQPKYQDLFSIAGPGDINSQVEYDPMSIMHFHERAFSKNGRATIVPVMPGLRILPSDRLSQLDKMKLRLAFSHECNRRSVDRVVDTCKVVLQDKVEKNVSNKEINKEEAIKDEVVESKTEGEEKNEKVHEKQAVVDSKEINDKKERDDDRESKKTEDEIVEINQEEKKENEHHGSKGNEEKTYKNLDTEHYVKKKEGLPVSDESIISPEENVGEKYAERSFQRQSNKGHGGKQANNYKEPLFHILPADKNVISSHSNDKDSLFFLVHSGQFNKSRVKGKLDNKETFFRTQNKIDKKGSRTDRFINPGQVHKSRKRNKVKLKMTNKTLSKDPKRMQRHEKKVFRKKGIKDNLN